MKRAAQKNGQAMILTVLSIGGTMLAATSVAGLLITYQIRQATDLTTSAKAIYAADAGLEWGLYEFFQNTAAAAPAMTNGSAPSVTCYDGGGNVIACQNISMKTMRSKGVMNGETRAFELSF